MKPWSYALMILTVIGVVSGWQVANWRRDSLERVIEHAAQAASEASRDKTQQIASQSGARLEQQLDELRQAQPKEIHREIIKPVFTNVCLSPEFVELYNDSAASIERTLSGQPVKKVP